MGTVRFTMESDINRVKRDMERLQAANEKLEQKLRDVSATSSRGNNQFLGQVGGMIAGYISINKAIELGNQLLEDKIRLEREAHQQQMTSAGARGEVLRNLAGVPIAQQQEFLRGLGNVAVGAGVGDVTKIYQAGASALSATGGNIKQSKDILAATSPLFLGSGDQIAPAVGSVADIMDAANIRDARRALGLMVSVQGQGRPTSLGLAMRNFAPVGKAMAEIDTLASGEREVIEAGGLFAGMSVAMGDQTGEKTKTAVINLAQKLEQAFPAETTGLRSTRQRIQAVQQSEQLQKMFFEGDADQGIKPATFGAESSSFITSLLTDSNSKTAQTVKERMAAISADPRLYEDMVRSVGGGQAATTELFTSRATARGQLHRKASPRSNMETARKIAIEEGYRQISGMQAWGMEKAFNIIGMVSEEAAMDYMEHSLAVSAGQEKVLGLTETAIPDPGGRQLMADQLQLFREFRAELSRGRQENNLSAAQLQPGRHNGER